MYRAESGRREARSATTSPEDYLRSLELVATVGDAHPEQLTRLAQLTQRTNQFNLTTRRYEVGQIEALASDPAARVVWLDLEDRFGKYGIVGMAILTKAGDAARIDTFLLSCRVLGRRIESVMITVLAERARELGAVTLIGEYLPSERNAQVADLYDRLGFTPSESVGEASRWEWSLPAGDPDRPDFVRIVDLGDGAQ
jgi:FkbH-like protein